jgi:hypothetical protein
MRAHLPALVLSTALMIQVRGKQLILVMQRLIRCFQLLGLVTVPGCSCSQVRSSAFRMNPAGALGCYSFVCLLCPLLLCGRFCALLPKLYGEPMDLRRGAWIQTHGKQRVGPPG